MQKLFGKIQRTSNGKIIVDYEVEPPQLLKKAVYHTATFDNVGEFAKWLEHKLD